jgi:porin
MTGTDDYAASGVFRHFGSWELLGRGTDNTGTLNYLIEYRHRFADVAPIDFSLNNAGNVGVIGLPYDDDKWHLTNLYWTQSWMRGRIEAVAGFLDVTDFVDVWPLTSPWTDFNNYVFSIGAGTMDLPNDAALGAAAGAWLTDHLYVIGGLEDLNAYPTDPFRGFGTFFGDNEYFKHLEVGWTTSPWEQYYLNNVHVTLWHADERDELEVDDGWGIMSSFTHSLGEEWLVFLRGGYSEGGGSPLETSVSGGFGYQPRGTSDQLGFGANWGRPNDDVFGSDLRDQYALEAYYRLQVTQELAITPDVQLLINPALNPERDMIWVFGVRLRFAL